jgi:adenylate cyclase
MFSDIRDFTKIAEKLEPQALTHLINSILTPLTAAIYARQGTVDKYIGDCIMAFWNAPIADAEHRRNALLAALGMREALAAANRRLAEEAAKANRAFAPVGVGIGINSGPCSVGNMGSEQRFAYSALGDTVNLASRLESLTRAYGVEIIVGEDAAEGISDMALLEIDRVRVKGRSTPLTIYVLLGAAKDAAFGRIGRRRGCRRRTASWPLRRWGRSMRSSPPASPITKASPPCPIGTASTPPSPRPARTAPIPSSAGPAPGLVAESFGLASRPREVRKVGAA